MLTIWGRASSSNVMKVLWLCEELAIPYERRDAGGAFGQTREPAYLAMNPMARVPTVVEADGFSLWESNAILRYLAARHGATGRWHGADSRARALCEKWMDWQLAHLGPPMTTILFTLYRTPEPERDMPALARARDEAEALLALLDSALEGRDWLGGEAPSLADVAMGPFVHRWHAFPIERRPLPRLEALYGRMRERPGYARHIAVPVT